jgi:DNA polymerase III delta prime subunit
VARRLVKGCPTVLRPITDVSRREKSRKLGFKNPGPSGFNLYRALLLYGPPGIGKTTSAHLCAKMAGYTPIELNASDARSKKLVEVSHSSRSPADMDERSHDRM